MGYKFKIVSVANNTMSAQDVVTAVKAHIAGGTSAVTNPSDSDFELRESKQSKVSIFSSVQVSVTTPTQNGQRGDTTQCTITIQGTIPKYTGQNDSAMATAVKNYSMLRQWAMAIDNSNQHL